jgi:hypothetical protein
VPLEWPVTVDGQVVDHVVIRRMTTKEVVDFVERLQQDGDNGPVRFPMVDLPDDVLDALDDDDAAAINEAVVSFLPLRLRVLVGGTPPRPGEDTSLS